jgi:hypothetical protein
MKSILRKFQISNKNAYESQKPNIIYDNQGSEPSINTINRDISFVQFPNLLLKEI